MRLSRRDFLKLLAGGSAAVVLGVASMFGWVKGLDQVLTENFPIGISGWRDIRIAVNGSELNLKVKSNWTLLKVLREDLNLKGTKSGCLNSECGACTVLLDGQPVYACHRLAIELDGHSVTTVEGVSKGGVLSPVQQAFVDEGAFQCGYCAPGFVMAATALLASNPQPDEQEVKEALSGNLCRCGNYDHITKAVLAAADGGQ